MKRIALIAMKRRKRRKRKLERKKERKKEEGRCQVVWKEEKRRRMSNWEIR